LNRFEVVSKRIVARVVSGIFSLVRFFADSVSASDELEKDIDKGIDDTASASDVFDRVAVYDRSFIDDAAAGDAVAKLIGKGLDDSVAAVDVSIKAIIKAISNPVSVPDSGRVLNQDYVDGFYFADDYVGTKREF
jgi:hypothetical protein